ncbi:MAG TPA: cytochrome c oxidase assembly factor Coa1 family protein [Syntrophales bacterium]|nr:cytochrome c oxidase assembly factor Coa1 family protein [Syntrophales bacterium]
MIIICSNCGKVNEVKQRRWRRPSMTVTCRHCGYRTTIDVGATAPSPEKVRCPACGYKQAAQDLCVKCRAPLYSQPLREEKKPAAPERKATSPPAKGKVLRFMITGLALMVLLTIGLLAGILYVVKASEAYRTAESFIRNSEEIREAVGSPLRFGLFPAGSVQTSRGRGTADLKIHVKGPKGETDVRIRLTLENGRWDVLSAVFTDAAGTRKRITGELRPKAPENTSRRNSLREGGLADYRVTKGSMS